MDRIWVLLQTPAQVFQLRVQMIYLVLLINKTRLQLLSPRLNLNLISILLGEEVPIMPSVLNLPLVNRITIVKSKIYHQASVVVEEVGILQLQI